MNGLIRDVPVWVKAAVLLGVPSLISLFLVSWLTTSLDGKLNVMAGKIDYYEQIRARDMARENAFLYAICLNTASSDIAKARCLIAFEPGLNTTGIK